MAKSAKYEEGSGVAPQIETPWTIYIPRTLSEIKGETVLLKISGESLSGEGGFGLKREPIYDICSEINSVAESHRIAIVNGGGNWARGPDIEKNITLRKTPAADELGMLATVMNALVLEDVLERDFGRTARVMSAREMSDFCEPYIRKRAIRHLEKGRIIILPCGMGVPNFSTDMAMVNRAKELGVGIILKGTKVDGIYNKDPRTQKGARFIPEISYRQYIMKDLKIVDPAAVRQAQDMGIEIRVFNLFVKGNLKRVLTEKSIGSVIR